MQAQTSFSLASGRHDFIGLQRDENMYFHSVPSSNDDVSENMMIDIESDVLPGIGSIKV
jgi:hypothetical protein